MTNLLRKLFIKDYNNTGDNLVRKKHGLLAAFVGVVTNLLLATFKVIIGVFTASMTIVTDAIDNLTDLGSCFVNILGFTISNKPADKKHPYGHQRVEYIAGLIICFIMIALAIFMGYSAVLKIINKEHSTYTDTTFIFAIVILVVAILVKLWQSFFYKKMSKIINSVSLKASSQDSLNDVVMTSVVLTTTILDFILNKYNVYLDNYFSIAVSIFIIISGVKLAIETCSPLIGDNTNNEHAKNIVKDILNYNGVLGVHDMMCHSYGPTKMFMTIHVEVDSEVNVLVSHELIDKIENEIGKKYNLILTIHMDPVETHSEEVIKLKNETKRILNSINPSVTFHDFRIVNGENRVNVLFDIAIPNDIKIKENELISKTKEEFNKLDSKYNLIIKVDYNYID